MQVQSSVIRLSPDQSAFLEAAEALRLASIELRHAEFLKRSALSEVEALSQRCGQIRARWLELNRELRALGRIPE